MDYSLLLSVYNVDEMKGRQNQMPHKTSNNSSVSDPPPTIPSTSSQPGTSSAAVGGAGVATPGPINRGRSTKQRLQQYTTAMESIQADSDPVEIDDEDIPYVIDFVQSHVCICGCIMELINLL